MDSSLSFDIISENEYGRWDEFVNDSLEGSIYARTWYLDAVGLPFRIGVVKRGQNWLGGIVLTKNELGTYSNPLFVKYLGILYANIGGKNYNIVSQKISIAETIIENIRGIKTFDYTFHPSFSNWMPFYWYNYRQETRYTYQIKVRALEQGRSQFKQTVRTQERKAQKLNIKIVTELSLESFYRIISLSFLRQGSLPPFSFQRFVSYYDRLKKREAIKFLGAVYDQDIVAVAGVVYDQKSANLLFNGIDPLRSSLAANTLLIVEAIKFGLENSLTFDFEGSMIKPIERFYRSFGGQLCPYYNIWKPNIFNTIKRKLTKVYKRLRYRT